MLPSSPPTKDPSNGPDDRPDHGSNRWLVWIDGGGGYLVLSGDTVRIGGSDSRDLTDVTIRADLPRYAGTVTRTGEDYFWQAEGAARQWIEPNKSLPGLASAQASLTTPSPLCRTAVLTLDAPHRFADHVDGVILADQTWLIGPTADCHARCRSLQTTMIVQWRDTGWHIKSLVEKTFTPIQMGVALRGHGLSLLLEEAK